MALAAKKVSVCVAVVILLLFSAASFSTHLARSSKKIQSSTWEDRSQEGDFRFYVDMESWRGRVKYQTYLVELWKHPNGEDDDKDARRRWYQSFLPSPLTDSGEPRLLHCDFNGFLAMLTRDEALALASKPGIRRMSSNEMYSYSKSSCGFNTTRRSFVPSRPAFSGPA